MGETAGLNIDGLLAAVFQFFEGVPNLCELLACLDFDDSRLQNFDALSYHVNS